MKVLDLIKKTSCITHIRIANGSEVERKHNDFATYLPETVPKVFYDMEVCTIIANVEGIEAILDIYIDTGFDPFMGLYEPNLEGVNNYG